MHKKRSLFPSKKAQVTIFIILGIFVVFIFLFLIRLNVQATTRQLETAQQEVLLKGFKKEALRIFVEDCLRDELRESLRLIARQGGRIWNDQPGGSEEFRERVNGVRDPHTGDRVAYGLLREGDAAGEKYGESSSPQAYPCNDFLNQPPAFCKYLYPASHFPAIQFGQPLPWESLLEEDVENHLKAKAQECIDTFLREKVKSVSFTPTEFTLDVDVREDGVAVEAVYPLRFSAEGEQFFHLSTFDFFYPSQLRTFLRAAIYFPLQMDWQYVDFPYTEGTLTAPRFTLGSLPSGRTTYANDYRALGIRLTSVEPILPAQDTLFTFTAPFPHVVDTPEEFVFKVARQNRPPALDYISREACFDGSDAEQYDYLVVKGADWEMGRLSFELKARDPDDEEEALALGYSIEDEPEGLKKAADTSLFPLRDRVNPVTHRVELSDSEVSDLKQDTYKITAKVKEVSTFTGATLLEDAQEVRIKVDGGLNPTDPTTKLELEYPFTPPAGFACTGTTCTLSREDPFKVVVTPPSGTATISALTYRGNTIPVEDPACVFMPLLDGACDFADYYQSPESDTPFLPTEITAPYSWFTSNPGPEGGALRAIFSLQYCPSSPSIVTSHKEINLQWKACMPLQVENKLPYVPETEYHLYTLDASGKVTMESGGEPQKDSTNPYAAPHACCKDDGTLKAANEYCLDNENFVGCFDAEESTYLKIKKIKCGKAAEATYHIRGNVCGGDVELLDKETGKKTCGKNNDLFCDDIAPSCEEKEAGSLQSGGWCSGDTGCETFCSGGEPLVDTASTTSPDTQHTIVNPAQFSCDTCSGNVGNPCDKNYDGYFKGTCSADGSCTGAGETP